MAATSDDRWTCPWCGETTARPSGQSAASWRAGLADVQRGHRCGDDR